MIARAMHWVLPRLQRLILRSTRYGLGRLWGPVYLLLARAYAAYLRRDLPDSCAFLSGSLSGGEPLYGLTDIDVAVVVAPDLRGPGVARSRIRRRCQRVAAALPVLGPLLFDWPMVFEDDDLADVNGNCTLTYRLHDARGGHVLGAAYSWPYADEDKIRVLENPGISHLVDQWRVVAGVDRRPSTPLRQRDELRLAAWLELQYWWRWAFDACAHPERPSSSHLSVKLAAESARIWLWLARGERVGRRSDVLRRVAEELPEQAAALARMRQLQADLTRLPSAPLGEALTILLGFSARIASALGAETTAQESTTVRLAGDPADLGFPHGDWEEVMSPGATAARVSPGAAEPVVLPLLDWRALACPGQVPDETFALLDGDATDPATLAALATATDRGPYPTVMTGELLLRPTTMGGRGRLRSVQCPATDPVSFALSRGATRAEFPNALGLSIQDGSSRAIREHGVWLTGSDCLSRPSVPVLGRLITAARAALVWESVRDGDATLPVSARATLSALRERSPVADHALETYEAVHLSWDDPPRALLLEFRAALLRLPAYGTAELEAATCSD